MTPKQEVLSWNCQNFYHVVSFTETTWHWGEAWELNSRLILPLVLSPPWALGYWARARESFPVLIS